MRMRSSDLPRYVISALIGGLVFVLVGYLIYAAPGDAVNFGYWINNPIRFYVWSWALIGAAVGAGTVILTRL